MNETVKLLTIQDVARTLKVSQRALRDRRAAGTVIPPTVDTSGLVRWRADEFTAWVCAGCPNPTTWSWSAANSGE